MFCTSTRYARYFFFFFNDTATTEIYTLSLHDALPILQTSARWLTPRISNSVFLGLISGASTTWRWSARTWPGRRSEEHTSELQSQSNVVCRLLLEKKKTRIIATIRTVQVMPPHALSLP